MFLPALVTLCSTRLAEISSDVPVMGLGGARARCHWSPLSFISSVLICACADKLLSHSLTHLRLSF